MSVTTLKDVLIEKDQLDRFFDKSIPVDLWRALKKKSGQQPFDFVEKGFVLSNGRPRPADITIERRANEDWVCVKDRPRGLSTFDEKGVPKGNGWEYFKIPKGTKLPEGLAIVKDEYNSKFEATHYTIAPAFDMPISQFKSKLLQLAKQLIKEAA
ncbi:Tse2 family ADP-ribosyltransferase toxin [Microbulbifer sp. JTAC008]|uniref:Tse2 family ADP-ribosyltransferase toxin n=1 Tax=unclassified Microbulbifer TaxID=2619833 RepID=UPI00403A5D19